MALSSMACVTRRICQAGCHGAMSKGVVPVSDLSADADVCTEHSTMCRTRVFFWALGKMSLSSLLLEPLAPQSPLRPERSSAHCSASRRTEHRRAFCLICKRQLRTPLAQRGCRALVPDKAIWAEKQTRPGKSCNCGTLNTGTCTTKKG